MPDEAKFTPGPWTYRRDDLDLVVEGPCSPGLDSDYIATVYSPEGLTDRDRANAKLIASAPDLLAACEKLLQAFNDFQADDSTVYPDDILLLIASDIQMAIAKAK